MWKQTTMGKFMIATAVLSIVAVALVAVRWAMPGPAVTAAAPQGRPAATPAPGPKTLRILHIMSFHSPWEWTDSQFTGFKDGLSDLKVEFKVYQMDAKRQKLQRAPGAGRRGGSTADRPVEAGPGLHQ